MIEHKTIEEHIADMEQRVARMETGGKPMIALSNPQTQEFSLANGNTSVRHFQLQWQDSTIEGNPKGQFYFDFYIDDVLQTEPPFWHYSERRLSADIDRSHAEVIVSNNTGSTKTYKIIARWVYLGGAKGDIAL